MKYTLLLLLSLLTTLSLSGQSDPKLKFDNITLEYGDGPLTLEASSAVPNGIITYVITEGDDVVALNGTTLTIKKAGTAKIEATIAASGEYDEREKTAEVTVSQRSIIVDIHNIELIYGEQYLSQQHELKLNEGSLAYEETIDILSDFVEVRCLASLNTVPVVDTYYLTLHKTDKEGNYSISTENGMLDVKPKKVRLIIESEERTYGEPKPTFDYYFPDGLVNGDSKSNILPQPQLDCHVTKESPVGNYPITLQNPDAAGWNYEFEVTPGNLEIRPALLSVRVNDLSRYYREENPELKGASISGFANGQDASIIDQYGLGLTADGNTISGPYLFLAYPDINEFSPPGPYEISIVANLSAPNYTFTYLPGELTIKEAPITITIKNLNKLTGAINPNLDQKLDKDIPFTHAINLDPDSFGFNIDRLITNCDENSQEGTYVIGYGFDPDTVNKNYKITLNEGTLYVWDSASIDDGPTCDGACRDSVASLYVESNSPGVSLEWWVKFDDGAFIPLNQDIIDSLHILVKSTKLELGNAQEWQENYKFKCLLTSEFREDSLIVNSKLSRTEIWSDPGSITLDATPPYAKVSLKGSILICRDLTETNAFQWGKNGHEISGETKPYIDISYDLGNSSSYWVKTIHTETQCAARSNLLTNGFSSIRAPYIPGSFSIKLFPQPISASDSDFFLEVLDPDPGDYIINIFNQSGTRKLTIKETSSGNSKISKNITLNGEYPPGIYFVEFEQASGRDVEKLLIYDD